jgi:alpha-1,3-rhamnosyl/mannosyltransferase
MNVLFNQTSTFEQKTGVGHYAYQLRDHLTRAAGCRVSSFPADRWLKLDRRMRALWARLRSLRGSVKHPCNPLRLFGPLRGLGRACRNAYLRWIAWTHEQAFFGNRYDLYHEPNFIPFPSSLPTVTTLHDLSVVLHPEWHPDSRVRWYEANFPRSLKQSSHFVTVSDFTRQQVIQHLGIPRDQVTSVPNGYRPEFRPLPIAAVKEVLWRRQLPPRYLLYVGTIEPRKNVLTLMQAYVSLPEQVRCDWPLLLVGGWGWKVERERAYYEDVARHKGVHHTGYVPDEDLPALLNGARALVYPSKYEGFGLPPLEMLACGGAVLASRIPPIVEVASGAAHLVAPEDVDGWRDAMQKVVSDHDWWRELRRDAVTVAARFTWERSARETAKVYRRVLAAARNVAFARAA